MGALIVSILSLTLLVLLVRTFFALPLVRMLSIAIDNWADEQHALMSGGRERPAPRHARARDPR